MHHVYGCDTYISVIIIQNNIFLQIVQVQTPLITIMALYCCLKYKKTILMSYKVKSFINDMFLKIVWVRTILILKIVQNSSMKYYNLQY